MGFVSPSEVNQYIQQDINSKIGSGFVYLSTGSSNISLAYSLNFSLSVPLASRWKLILPLEYGFASKNVMINSTSYRYTMDRFTLGGLTRYTIPSKKSDNAFYFSGGLLYHAMSYRDYSGGTIGPRAEWGVIFYTFKLDYETFIIFDYAKANTDGPQINFSGVYFGFRVMF